HALALAPAGGRLTEARRVLELLTAAPEGQKLPPPP
ncbi:MAG: hypothetical protein QOK29_3969, partial [Rhodospirillaceae bacterium]|nr:hypothetical protein [Rhodospirillaceae bacterium]